MKLFSPNGNNGNVVPIPFPTIAIPHMVTIPTSFQGGIIVSQAHIVSIAYYLSDKDAGDLFPEDLPYAFEITLVTGTMHAFRAKSPSDGLKKLGLA